MSKTRVGELFEAITILAVGAICWWSLGLLVISGAAALA